MRTAENPKNSEFIKTYVRIKPIAMDQLSQVNATKHEVTINRYNNEHYEYNQVFGESCKNEYIFQTVMKPIVSHIFEGYNACILAYGQTSSGKTYTMKGVDNNLGLIPLTIRHIFKRIKQEAMVAKVSISYFQIYNENIIDLLSKDNSPRYLQVRDDWKKNAIVQDLIEPEVSNEDESLTFYSQGETKRKFACNNINLGSSRSHTIFRINLEVAHQNLTTSISTISLVDLAGSESISKTNAVGLLKKESENINKSLLALSNVIRSLSQKSNYINFRDSRLTRILQPCLTGHSKTVVICTINQTEECVGETINTLKFGVAANSIKISAQRNITTNPNPSTCADVDSKYEQLYQLLKDQRSQKQYLSSELLRLKSQLTRYKQFQSNALAQINDLKYKLLLEQNQNINNNVLLNQLKDQKDRKQAQTGNSFGSFNDDLRMYKAEIARLEIANAEIRDTADRYKKMNQQLERNERTLLDRITKYQRELSALQQSLNEQQAQHQSAASHPVASKSKKSKMSEGDPLKERLRDAPNRQTMHSNQSQFSDNPYTISKIIQLSTRILDIKIQLNEYLKANAQLQQENQRQAARIEFLEKNVSEEEQVSQRSKTSRVSGGSKFNEHEFKSLKQENKRLKVQKIGLMKKLNQLRATIKKNSSNYIDELQGFNRFIDKNFTQREKEYFQFLFDQDPNDYQPRPPNAEPTFQKTEHPEP